MFEIIFLFVLGLIWIIFATIQDLKTREVANWLNFSLIIFVLGFRFFYSLFNSNWNFFLFGLMGFALFFILGNLLYYGRIFAGGDAKLMIALGPIVMVFSSIFENLVLAGIFLFLFFFSGAIYGLFFGLGIYTKNFKKVNLELKKKISKIKKYFLLFGFFIFVLFLILSFFDFIFFFLAIIFLLSVVLFLFAKSLEDSCMFQIIPVSQLREGDWLFENLKKEKFFVKAKWEGLSNKDIQLIKKRFKKVKIKQGIPFVPAFLIGFILFILLILFVMPRVSMF